MAFSVASALFALILVTSPIISSSSSCPFSDGPHHNHPLEDSSTLHGHGSGCNHLHHNHHHHDHPHQHHRDHPHHPEQEHQRERDNHHSARDVLRSHKLPEELAEEEELALNGFEQQFHLPNKHYHQHVRRASLGIWLRALGCSLLVSMASLICLVLLPFIVAEGRPSRIVVDFLAAFGAGAMLGDAFLHQLPHALGDAHSHGHIHEHHDHNHNLHNNAHDEGHGHAHSIQDLSVGLAVLAGIILFFIVEKIVRQVEKSSSKGALPWTHHYHHHHHHHQQCHDNDSDNKHQQAQVNEGHEIVSEKESVEENLNDLVQDKSNAHEPRRRKNLQKDDAKETDSLLSEKDDSEQKFALAPVTAPNLVLGYLNLFSDGVHNFTDGMALGSAFLNHGTIGGWSRTLFLLAHEIPQEVGDFGILLQSGFTVFKALAFNFLSALVALAGTALALLWGGSPENSSLIEGFTAGGFIYIAVAGVMPEMHQTGTSAKITLVQLIALVSGMSVALLISLIE